MTRYILKRVLHMAPTVAGVLLLTFLLFNVVGGSPAELLLGKNATASALEAAETQRGLDKPLFAGRWCATRAFPDADYHASMGGWSRDSGARYVIAGRDRGFLRLPAGGRYTVPLAFELRPGARYRWVLRHRGTGADAAVHIRESGGARRIPLTPSAGWRNTAIDFTVADPATAADCAIEPGGADLQVAALRLRRRNAHLLDTQFAFFLGQVARLELGTSIETQQKVSSLLKAGALPSLCLTVPILLGSLAIALSLALVCGLFRNRWLDRLLVLTATALMSVNYVVWVVAGQYLLGFRAGWFPVWGFESWRYLLLPVLIGVATGFGRDLRLYRSVVLEEMNREYVRMARAKGAGTARILFRHVLPNVAIPVVTNVSMSLPFLFTGSLLLESFFGIPGLGSASVNAINGADLDVVRALVLVGSLLYVAVNLLTDLCYAWLDPRVRLG